MVATSYPSNDTAVSTSYNSNDHHELSNSFNSGYDYHAVDSNMMAAAFLSQDINACTNLPPTSSGFTQGLPPLPPPQFFQKEQQLISTAHDSQMIGCNGDTDLILHENLNDHATCNSLQQFTVASSTLDHTNTVPVFQSEKDPQWMIQHKNYLDHAAEDVGSDCGVIVGTGMELGGAILTSGVLPIENPLDTLFLNYGESAHSTSPPSVRDGDLIMTPMQASGGGGPGAYLLTDQFDVCSFNPLWEVVGGNQRSRTTHLGEFPSHMYGALCSGDHTGLAMASLSNNRHAPMASSFYTSNHAGMATSYTSDDRAATANSYSGNQTAVMASYPGYNCHAETAESSYFVNHMVVATSYPSNHIAVSTSYTSNNHHDALLNSSYSHYIYHAGDGNMMTVAIRNNLARCNLLQEYFTVAHSTLDHTGPDRITNTVPVHQSVNDPHCTIRHKNYLEHPGENGGSDCAAIMGPGMKPGGRSHYGRMLPTENPMDTEFLSYMESVNFTSTPRVDDGDLIMAPMQASSGGDGRPGAYYPSAQFGVGSSDQSRGVDGGNLSGRQPI
ncbi:hypothetical protein Ancab_000591 [Ancistrocladus abbreviatus]